MSARKAWRIFWNPGDGDALVLLDDGAWTNPARADEPYSATVPLVLQRSKTFPTKRAAVAFAAARGMRNIKVQS